MSDQSSSRDWKDPFGPGGGETFDPDAPRKGNGAWWIVALCLIAAAVTGAFYLFENPLQFVAPERVIVVGLPETVSVVVQVDVPKTLAGLDDVLEADASGMLGKMLEMLERREGINVPLEEVEYLVAAIDQPTWMLKDLPQDQWVDSMLIYVRFKTSDASGMIVPPGTPKLPSTDGSTVYQIDRVLASLVDERTWLLCPSGLLTKAQEAYEQEAQPDWMDSIESSGSMVIAGRISGMPGPDFTQEIEVLVSGSLGRPCIVNGYCTTPRMDQAQQLLSDLDRMLNQDFNGRGAIRNTFFESADLALNRRTVTFEGTIAAEEVKLAMAPVTLMIGMLGLASIAEARNDPPVDEPLPDVMSDDSADWLILEGEYDSQVTAEALDRIVQQYLDEGNYEAALDACTRGIAMHPEEAALEVLAIEKRANIFMTIENYEQALAEYELVRVKNPDLDSVGRDRLARAWMGSGRALIALNRTDEALEHFQSGLDVFDDEDDISADRLALRVARAQLNRQLGNTDEAVDELEVVIQLSQFDSVTTQSQAELESIRSEQPPEQD